MELAEIIAVVQLLGGLGAVAVDVTKVVDAIKADGRTKATPVEEAHIEGLLLPHVHLLEALTAGKFDPVGFLKAASPGHAGG